MRERAEDTQSEPHTGVCKKHSSGGEGAWANRYEKHQTRGWREVPAAELQGQGSHQHIVFSDTGSLNGMRVGSEERFPFVSILAIMGTSPYRFPSTPLLSLSTYVSLSLSSWTSRIEDEIEKYIAK